MSRVMLALKVSVEEGKWQAAEFFCKTSCCVTPRTLVFDEIDTGIGGRAAEAVGQKLKTLELRPASAQLRHTSAHRSAAFADQHFLIEKREDHGRTKVQVRLLDDRTRVEEVARMLSGAVVTEASQHHASQMIQSSK